MLIILIEDSIEYSDIQSGSRDDFTELFLDPEVLIFQHKHNKALS
jgi:hypothetical protein